MGFLFTNTHTHTSHSGPLPPRPLDEGQGSSTLAMSKLSGINRSSLVLTGTMELYGILNDFPFFLNEKNNLN